MNEHTVSRQYIGICENYNPKYEQMMIIRQLKTSMSNDADLSKEPLMFILLFIYNL